MFRHLGKQHLCNYSTSQRKKKGLLVSVVWNSEERERKQKTNYSDKGNNGRKHLVQGDFSQVLKNTRWRNSCFRSGKIDTS